MRAQALFWEMPAIWSEAGGQCKCGLPVFLLFTSDKRRVVGCCGSNRFFGPATIQKDGSLSIGMLGATRMATPFFQYEKKFLEDLQAARRYRFEQDGTLLLLDIDGAVCMRLQAVSPPTAGEK